MKRIPPRVGLLVAGRAGRGRVLETSEIGSGGVPVEDVGQQVVTAENGIVRSAGRGTGPKPDTVPRESERATDTRGPLNRGRRFALPIGNEKDEGTRALDPRQVSFLLPPSSLAGRDGRRGIQWCAGFCREVSQFFEVSLDLGGALV